jgi:hypothetical protein
MGHPFLHLRTILKHRHKVISHCFRVGIGCQGLRHDLSKLSPTEFIPGAKYYQGTRSPNEGEREALGYSRAWLHHKGRNRHHFEYWVDIDPVEKCYKPVKMPLKYVVEMFCDRVAASKIYAKENYSHAHPLAYFMRGKSRRSIHPETSDFLEKLLTMLEKEGEKQTFRYIKQFLKHNRDY